MFDYKRVTPVFQLDFITIMGDQKRGKCVNLRETPQKISTESLLYRQDIMNIYTVFSKGSK